MNKAIMIAEQPKWLKMVLDGDKDAELRKWKVPVGTVIYFYCTKAKPDILKREYHIYNLKPYDGDDLLNGKVVAKAVVSKVSKPTSKSHYLYGMTKQEYIDYVGDEEHKYHALELSQVESIEPKDITEFISWNKLQDSIRNSYGVDENNCEDLEDLYVDVLYEMIDFLKENKENYEKFGNVYLDKRWITKPPQSRTWIYIEEESNERK